MSTKNTTFGPKRARIILNEQGSACINTGEPGGLGGHLTICGDRKDGNSSASLGGGKICLEQDVINHPGQITCPWPMSMLPSIASFPQRIFLPPFMDLLPMLGPVVAASAAVVALGAIAKSSRG